MDLTATTYKGANPLHIAASAKDSNTVGLLLESYYDSQREMIVNQPDRTGCTPLHYACLSGRLESVFLLLNAGANPVITYYDGRTPLYVCAAFRKIIIRPEKDHNRCDPPGWHHLIGDDDTLRMTEIIQLLRAHGADTLKSDQAGNTPFELAVDNGNQEMIAALHVDTANPLNPTPAPHIIFLAGCTG
ncbi:ankyrin repeat domain-containing protein [Aspergillus alliaceus]|uniref:ankyrin repeat domain-containing protein n=1 Tax=Petromyces alliaceus TaxID=209559 RepID=UPI0012A71259|nr:ankyrin repeat-containing domain protein [Aspergillus alliaceus]KAB8229517.1 ankyrin repeat-containing domain protein [Aspergillus alliaceus]